MKKIAVFASGEGTTLDYLCEASKQGSLKAKISVVITNNCGIKAEDVARKYNINCCGIPKNGCDGKNAYKTIENWSEELYYWAENVGLKPDLIVLAGFNQKIHVPARWEKRIINIHPSLLPKYGGKGMFGLNVHQAVIDAKEIFSGCSVHVVDNIYDHGPIIDQIQVPVFNTDDAISLQNRIKLKEKILLTKVINEYVC